MTINSKFGANFGNIILVFAKFNKGFLEMIRRRGHTNGKMSECKLRKMSFHHYGYPSRDSNYFLIKSTNDIFYQTIRDFRGLKIMILYNHDSHDEIAWDFETYQARDYKTILLIVIGIRVESSCRDLAEKEVQMCTTEEEEQDIGRIDMGEEDLNRLEPMKMENFKVRIATQFLLKEGGFLTYMQAMAGYDKNCALQFVNGWNDYKVTINEITFQVNEEVIAMATGLSMKGKKWRKVTKTFDEASMNNFFAKDEELI